MAKKEKPLYQELQELGDAWRACLIEFYHAVGLVRFVEWLTRLLNKGK